MRQKCPHCYEPLKVEDVVKDMGTQKETKHMIEIGLNPNTKNASVAIRLNGYFGINKDGIKLVDSDVVFPADKVRLAGVLPITAFDTLQKAQENTVEKLGDEKDTRFKSGPEWKGNPNGRPLGSKNKSKTPITDLYRKLLEEKHYKRKDGTWTRADELFAESALDRAILQGNTKMYQEILDRIEGKVTQSVKLSGALAHGTIPEKDIEKLKTIFPDI